MLKEISALHELSRALVMNASVADILSAIVEQVDACLSPEFVLVFLRQDDRLRLAAKRHGHVESIPMDARLNEFASAFCEQVLWTREALFTRDVHDDIQMPPERKEDVEVRSLAALPLLWRGEALGVLMLADNDYRDFSAHRSYLEILTGYAALALASASLQEAAGGKAEESGEEVEESSDYTDRSWVNEALRLSEERFRRITENMYDLLCYTDIQGRYLYLTPSYKRVLGYDPLDLLGESVFERVHPEDLEHVVKEFQKAITSRMSGQAELRYRHADGRYIWIHSTGTVITNELGEPVGAVINTRDITERREAEQALHESEEKYRTLVESIQDGVFLVQDARVLFTNAAFAEMIGRIPDEVIGGDFRMLIAPEDRSTIEDLHRRRLLGEPVPREYEIRLIHKDGETRVIVNVSVGMAHYQGKPAAIGTVKNVTERRQAEKERKRLEDQLRHFQKLESLAVLAGGIAHDFNNLLMGILGNTELGLISLPLDDPARANLQEIQSAVVRAAELCRQMLAYSGRGRFRIERIQINDLVKDMLDTIQVSVSRQVRLVYRLSDKLPWVEGDRAQLRQVLMNLIVNASESIGEAPGSITLSTKAVECAKADFRNSYLDENISEGSYVEIEVADTGCGMDEATRQKIFDPFFSTKFTGRGLGLAAVLGIVRGHKGAIEVRSEPGRGATFRILLPAIRQEADQLIRAGIASQSMGIGDKTILVVDDEEPVLTVARQMFEMLGFRVLTACDGVEAIEVMREKKHDIDLVVLDLAMPRMSGEETFHALKAIDPKIPIIISSGYSEAEVMRHFEVTELAGCIPKPFSFQNLKEALSRAFAVGETGSVA